MSESNRALSIVARMTGTKISPKAAKSQWEAVQNETPIFAEVIRANLP